MSRGCGTLFFGVFLAMGLAFTGFMVMDVLRTLATHSWPEAECEITSSRGFVNPEVPANEPPYYFEIAYEYTWEGRSYSSTRLGSGEEAYSDWSNVGRLLKSYPAGERVACYVNPEEPSDVILEHSSLWVILFLPLPLVFVAIGGVGIWAMWRKQKQKSGIGSISGNARAKKESKWAAPIVFLVLLAVGGGLLAGVFVKPVRQYVESQNWRETPCTVEFSRVGFQRGKKGDTHSVDILYSYSFEGAQYRSSRYKFFEGSSGSYSDKQAVVERHPAGATVSCYVDPGNPEEAVLDRGFPKLLLLGLIPLAFALVGARGLLRTLPKARAGGQTYPGGMAAPNVRISSTGAGGIDLKPSVGRWGKLIGVMIFAGFWNGIVSIFLWQVIDEWKQGNAPWFLTLFLVPFVLVGIGALIGVVWTFLALFNPYPRLQLTPGTLALGSRASLSWRIAGRVSSISRFRIQFKGREEATYRRGTKTRTDKSEFKVIDVFDSAGRQTQSQGQASFTVPADTMHSFASLHNKIIWSIHVTGEVRRWPDVDLEFPLEVEPSRLRGGF